MASPRIPVRLIRVLLAKRALLAAAESATGGRVADQVVSVPGSSEVFWGSVVSYRDQAKHRALRVPESLIRRFGAVSREVACAMAEGVYRLAKGVGPLVTVSTTGVAGPGGGTSKTPVGFCWIGIASSRSGGKARVVRVTPPRKPLSRNATRARFTARALEEALREAKKL